MIRAWLVLLTAFVVVPPTAAAAQSGIEGACPRGEGVTLVVDFADLDQDTLVRCGRGIIENGLDVLAEARVAYDPVPQNANVVCRMEGLPSTRACEDASDGAEQWVYWTARPGGDWQRVDGGPIDRDPPEGSVDGWSWTSTADPSPPRTDPPAPGSQRPDPDPTIDEATPADPDEPASPAEQTEVDGATGTPDPDRSEEAGQPIGGSDRANGSESGADGSEDGTDGGDDANDDSTAVSSSPSVDIDDEPVETGVEDPGSDTAAGATDDSSSADTVVPVLVAVLAVAALAAAAVLIRRERRAD